MSINQVISLFESSKEEVLTFPVHIKSREQELYVLRELMLTEDITGNPEMLAERLQKLPALLVFYGNLLDAAQRQKEVEQEDFDLWYAEVSETVNAEHITELSKTELPASLKKPLTVDQLRGKVMSLHKTVWKEKREKLSRAEERLSLLKRMVEGLNAAIRLVQSETAVMTALVNKGLVEPVSSGANSRLNAFMKKA